MTSNSEFGNISFDLPKNQSNVIKVIGVGGGGSNAINHMFKQGINGVDFIVCNTDSQALQNSPVPNKIQLGVSLTEGLGAGSNPDVGQQSAIESISDIEKMLDTNTKMIFITAGMGGGTGTGAAPIIAQLAKERDILTVGIVTIPFLFEGKVRIEQANIGVEKLRREVDSLIVINNNKLREVYGNLGFKAGFSKADEVLATASKGIAEVITHHYTQNIDLKDAKTVLSNSGTAIMGSATATGDNRAKEAITTALDSPLLNDNKITGAKNVLLLIVSGTTEITIDEIGEINDHIQEEAGHNANIIMGVGEDENLGDAIAVTIIATGFDIEQQHEIVNTEPKKIIHALEGDQVLIQDLSQKKTVVMFDTNNPLENPIVSKKEEFINQDLNKKFIENDNNLSKIVDISDNNINFANINHDSNSVSSIEKQESNRIIVNEEEQITFLFDNVDPNSMEHLNEPIAIKKYDLSENTTKTTDKLPTLDTIGSATPKDGIVRYSLEEYMELENELNNSKPVEKEVKTPVEEGLNFTLKKVVLDEEFEKLDLSKDSVSPTDLSIADAMKLKYSDEHRKKLKEFNYKFNNNVTKIEDLEKEPAYKRYDVDLTNKNTNNQISRTSFGTDSNNDIQIRKNNSYLHDIVD